MKNKHKVYIKGKWYWIDLDNRVLICCNKSTLKRYIEDYALEHLEK